jgi:mono/diheme cytochrome c family protein
MNLSRLLVLFATAIGLLTTACNQTNPGGNAKPQSSPAAPRSSSSTSDEFATTRASFTKHCAVCHGENANGGTVTVEGKKLKVPSLRAGHSLTHPNEELVKQVTKGGDGMPAFNAKLSAPEINDMVRFIRKEFQGANNPVASPATKTN